MSTIVCQNLFTRYESKSPDFTATLKLKPPEDSLPPPPASQFDTWGSFNHPNYSKKPSSSGLSPLSLELCTENLGSETGSEMSSPPYSPRAIDLERVRPPRRTERTNRKPVTNYPPPLLTMSGASTLQVRRRREEGRLIIEAVETPFRSPYLRAERSDGRLRLWFPGGEDDGAVEEEFTDGETEEIDLRSCRCKEGGCGRKEISHSNAWESRHLWVVT